MYCDISLPKCGPTIVAFVFMIVYQICTNEQRYDSDGWNWWVVQEPLDTYLYLTKDDALKAIQQHITDGLVIIAQAILNNPEYTINYTKDAELLKNNICEFVVGTNDNIEELPKYVIKELILINS